MSSITLYFIPLRQSLSGNVSILFPLGVPDLPVPPTNAGVMGFYVGVRDFNLGLFAFTASALACWSTSPVLIASSEGMTV